MVAMLAILAGLNLVQLASSQPTLAFPLNAQLPLAARIDTLFSYSFSPQTFQSSSKITYTLGDGHPSWLSIESDERRLFGTPKDNDVPPGDVVGQQVEIVATDDSGSTTMNSTLVISRQHAPIVEIPLLSQIKKFGNFSAPSSILAYPATEFKYSFDKKTFDGGDQLNYYAVSANNSPLPAWVHFDVSTLTFSGKTPPVESLVTPPQSFDLRLVASDIVGFSATSIPFSIVVGSHRLTTTNPVIAINATRGSKVTFDGLENGVSQDQKPVALGDLKIMTKGMPRWLNLSPAAGKLEGTPGNGDHSTNFTITFSDGFADSLDVLVMVNVATGLFESTFSDMSLRPGSKFDIDLSKYFRDPSDINVKVTTAPSEDWLKVDGFKISGTAPKKAKGGFDITVDASSKSSKLTETEKLRVTFTAADGTTTTTAGTSTMQPTSTSTGGTSTGTSVADAAGSSSSKLSTGDILLATIIPILFIALVVMLLVCFVRRRRARRNYLSSGYRSKISDPVLGSLRINGSNNTMHDNEQMSGAMQGEKHMFKPGKAALVDVQSRGSSRRRSSETLGNGRDSEGSLPPGLVVEDGRSVTIRSVSPPGSAADRQSWETVEGDAAMMSGGKSAQRDSDITVPESTRQLFPVAEFVPDGGDRTFRRNLETTVPTFEQPGMHTAPLAAYKNQLRGQKSVDAFSSITSSSVALPQQDRPPMSSRGVKPAASTIAETDTSEPNWETLTGTDTSGSVGGLTKPAPAALASRTTGDMAALQEDGSKSLRTDPSFGSSENWRLIGKRDPTNLTYKEIVDEAPFNPSRPGTARDGAQPGERGSGNFMSPSKWGDFPPARSGLSREESGIPHSVSALTATTSGGSFKVFL